MGQTIKRYPVVEVAIRCYSSAPLASGHERSLEGDVICVRQPSNGVGMQEMRDFLWLRISGWEENDFGVLQDGVDDGDTENPTRYEKRRYQIPLKRLEAACPAFDEAAARDRALIYQPFLGVDEDTGLYTFTGKPLEATGLVFDVMTQRYR